MLHYSDRHLGQFTTQLSPFLQVEIEELHLDLDLLHLQIISAVLLTVRERAAASELGLKVLSEMQAHELREMHQVSPVGTKSFHVVDGLLPIIPIQLRQLPANTRVRSHAKSFCSTD